MYGAVLTEPVEPDSQAGVLFMHNHGFSMMCGHGVIGVLTIATNVVCCRSPMRVRSVSTLQQEPFALR